MNPVVCLFQFDLRLADHPALLHANRAAPVIPVFLADSTGGPVSGRPLGAASRWWLGQSLGALEARLEAKDSRLIVRRGDATAELSRLVAETKAKAIFYHRSYGPGAERIEAAVAHCAREQGVEAHRFEASLLQPPESVVTGSGGQFKVFTPFWRRLQILAPRETVEEPARLKRPERWPSSLSLADLSLKPSSPWYRDMEAFWTPGEAGARSALESFLEANMSQYEQGRNLPADPLTSRLSPHLRFGEITAAQVWHAVSQHESARRPSDLTGGAKTFLAELGWREFSYHQLMAHPTLDHEPIRPEFKRFPWHDDAEELGAWQRGETGYPLVDAGMRELWQNGWMHNRVRMVVGSFLVKHLLLPWQAGERWFWDTLVDADEAANAQNWQWIAGCGADAAPYFRVFNPILQSKKFDPDGRYIHRWVPELRGLRAPYVHEPWKAPPRELERAGIKLGETYPEPIVDHDAARMRALIAYAKIKKAGK